jgi:hypothetical protein
MGDFSLNFLVGQFVLKIWADCPPPRQQQFWEIYNEYFLGRAISGTSGKVLPARVCLEMYEIYTRDFHVQKPFNIIQFSYNYMNLR